MVGALVGERRKALGWTQTDLGRRVGVSQNYISKLEAGDVELPQRGTLDALSSALNVPIGDFYRAAGILPPADQLAETASDVPPGIMALMREMVRQRPDLAVQFDAHRADEDFAAQVRLLARTLGYTLRGYLADEEGGKS